MRANGVCSLSITCALCHHQAALAVDHRPTGPATDAVLTEALFDNLVGRDEQLQRDAQPERVGRLAVELSEPQRSEPQRGASKLERPLRFGPSCWRRGAPRPTAKNQPRATLPETGAALCAGGADAGMAPRRARGAPASSGRRPTRRRPRCACRPDAAGADTAEPPNPVQSCPCCGGRMMRGSIAAACRAIGRQILQLRSESTRHDDDPNVTTPQYPFCSRLLDQALARIRSRQRNSCINDSCARVKVLFFFRKTGRFFKKNREAIEHERAITEKN
jgi:hypothetical protein